MPLVAMARSRISTCASGVQSVYSGLIHIRPDAQHASGTCRMGAIDDPRSVVDPECRVIGCTGLRVIDASIMPEVPRANTHLTTVAIAERMADRLKAAK